MPLYGAIEHSVPPSTQLPSCFLHHDDNSGSGGPANDGVHTMRMTLTDEPKLSLGHLTSSGYNDFLGYDGDANTLELGALSGCGVTIGASGGTVTLAGSTTLSALDGTVIGSNTAAAGTFTTATVATADINGGAIDGTAIGGSAPAAATFTTLAATGGLDSTAIGGNTAAAGTFTTLAATSGLDSTVIGGNTAAAGTFTTATVATADINGGAIDGTIIGGSTPAAATFTSMMTSSDRRIKENIVEHNCAEVHNMVMMLKGVDYCLISDASKEKKSGFLAQDVEEVFPQFVADNALGMKSVNYSQMTSILLSAIKHQQSLIDNLGARLQALE